MRGSRAKKIRKFAIHFAVNKETVNVARKLRKLFKQMGKDAFERKIIPLIHEKRRKEAASETHRI